jgi:acyl carrier protein
MSPATTAFDEVLPLVLRVVRAAVDAPADEIDEDTSLLDLPSFDSMKIVQVVEEIEQAAEVEIDPDRIVPETFSSVRTIAETVQSSAETSTSGTPGQDPSGRGPQADSDEGDMP